ncbi:MAG: DUF4407 domain-containing protein [Vicingaceae bacterium]
MNNFFVWCAGSDPHLLKHCSKREQIKHQGFGTLVLIPAILGFVSMSFALSTLDSMESKPWLYLSGGLLWGLIIFAFDRFIVSTHQKRPHQKEELKNPVFYLRFGFAFLLGIVISHPLVMFYFNGSIEDQLRQNQIEQRAMIQAEYNSLIQENDAQIALYDSAYQAKLEARNEQAKVVEKEIDGEVLENAKGNKVTTGLYGKGPAAEQKMAQLNLLQTELELSQIEYQKRKQELRAENKLLQLKSDSISKAFTLSADYLQRELALEQIKEKNSIVSLTQWLLISLFVLVDILPLIFKTFSSFGLYEKVQLTDNLSLKNLNTESRKNYLQSIFDQVNG